MATPNRSTQRLSELTRHLCLPSGAVTTAWPMVKRQLDRMKFPMDEWQVGLSKAILARRADGTYACGTGGAVMSIPRQSGKTHMVAGLVFGLCIAEPGTLAVWSAHRAKTHNETFLTMAALAEKPAVAPFVKNVVRGAGKESVEFANGSRILFGAREHGFGRGFAKVEIVVMDEAQILTEKAMEDMVPATNAARRGLVLLMGTPPRPHDPGEIFTGRRADALSGDPDTLYAEFSAKPGSALDDRGSWLEANPSYPHRTKAQAIQRMRKLLGDESFRREGLGIWDEKAVGKSAIPRAAWEAARVSAEDVPTEGRRVAALRFSIDGSRVALAVAIREEGTERVHVEGVAVQALTDGITPLLEWIGDRAQSWAQVVVEGKSGTGYAIETLRGLGVPKSAFITPTLTQVKDAHSMFLARLTQAGTITHLDQPELSEQALDARTRPIGQDGGFGWSPSQEDGSVALLDAATYAAWGAATTKRKPGRKGAIL